MHKTGTHSPAAPLWKLTKWLKSPFDEVSSTRTLRSIRCSKYEINGLMHPMLQAGVFPALDGARPNINLERNQTVLLWCCQSMHWCMAIFQPRVAPVRYRGFLSIRPAIRRCGGSNFRPMECWFWQAFSQDHLLNLLPQVLQRQPLCEVKRNEGRKKGKLLTTYTWKAHLLTGSWNSSVMDLRKKKDSYTRCFQVNYHKLYINRMVMNYRFRKQTSTICAEPSLRSKKPVNRKQFVIHVMPSPEVYVNTTYRQPIKWWPRPHTAKTIFAGIPR